MKYIREGKTFVCHKKEVLFSHTLHHETLHTTFFYLVYILSQHYILHNRNVYIKYTPSTSTTLDWQITTLLVPHWLTNYNTQAMSRPTATIVNTESDISLFDGAIY